METNQELLLRARIFGNLSKMFERTPDARISFWRVAQVDTFTEELLIKTYQDIGEFLTRYPEYSRIILYLPFELLPDEAWSNIHEPLRSHTQAFITAYRNAWFILILEQDVKAVFIDGNVPEPELGLGAEPLVSKAAHLTLELIQRNMITREELNALITHHNSLVKEGVEEIMQTVAQLKPSTSPLQASDLSFDTVSQLSVTTALRIITQNQQQIDNQYAADAKQFTVSRALWLKEVRVRELINSFVNRYFYAIDPWEYLTHEECELLQRIRIVCLSSQSNAYLASVLNPSRISFREQLFYLWNHGKAKVKHDLHILLNHIAVKRLLLPNDALIVSTIGRVPSFEQFWDGSISPLASSALETLRALSTRIQESELNDYVYPIAIAYGSHIKGYGMYDSDIDIACIVRPGVSFSDEEKIQLLIKRWYGEYASEKTLLFWTQKKNASITIKSVFDVPLNPRFVGDMMMCDILLYAKWLGDNSLIHEIQSAIYQEYASTTYPKLRTLWIQSLEHDLLQYRLLQKGYAYLFPKQVPVRYQSFEAAGSFWDSGFRRLATLIYLKKIFIPK